jgi:hypothetical protein
MSLPHPICITPKTGTRGGFREFPHLPTKNVVRYGAPGFLAHSNYRLSSTHCSAATCLTYGVTDCRIFFSGSPLTR